MLIRESIYIADPSDQCDFVINTDVNKEPSPYHIIIIMRVGEGKANSDRKVVFGVAVYHKNPSMCI